MDEEKIVSNRLSSLNYLIWLELILAKGTRVPLELSWLKAVGAPTQRWITELHPVVYGTS
jgi:hypothetical protein